MYMSERMLGYSVFTVKPRCQIHFTVNVFFFQGSYCAVFDNGIGRVIEDFSRPCSECPFKYPSADAMNCISYLLL